MKKLFSALALFAAICVQAQVKFAPGVRAGVNFAKISDTELGYKTDFYVAGLAGIQFNKVYTLQPEIGYSRQGSKGDYTYNSGGSLQTENIDISLQYVSFAVISKFTFLDRLSVMVGPTLDILVDQSDVNVENDTDVGATLGIGCRIVDGLGVEFRVKKGFKSTVEDNYYTDSPAFLEIDHTTNLVLQLGLTYTFKIK